MLPNLMFYCASAIIHLSFVEIIILSLVCLVTLFMMMDVDSIVWFHHDFLSGVHREPLSYTHTLWYHHYSRWTYPSETCSQWNRSTWLFSIPNGVCFWASMMGHCTYTFWVVDCLTFGHRDDELVSFGRSLRLCINCYIRGIFPFLLVEMNL